MNSVPKLVESELDQSVLILRIGTSRISDSSLSYALRDQVFAHADSTGVKDFVIDFSRVDFMGSVGLVVLLGLRRHVADSRIVLANLSEAVHAVLATSQLVPGYGDTAKVFDVAETVPEAIAKLNDGEAQGSDRTI